MVILPYLLAILRHGLGWIEQDNANGDVMDMHFGAWEMSQMTSGWCNFIKKLR